jgi:hypothetical protein
MKHNAKIYYKIYTPVVPYKTFHGTYLLTKAILQTAPGNKIRN